MTRYSFNTLNHSAVMGFAANLPEQVAAAAAAGYDHVGLDVSTVAAHEAAGLGPLALGRLMAEQGLSCFELVPLWLTADRGQFDDMLAGLLRVVEGLRPAVVYAISEEPPDERIATHFRAAAGALADVGVGCAIEFVAGWGVDTPAKALALAEAAGEGVGVVLDSWQCSRAPGGWRSAVATVPEQRVGFVQLADGLAEPEGEPMWEMSNRRALPGQGGFDLAGFRDAVRGRGYDGVVSVEVLSEEWRGRPVADFARASLAASRALWDSAVGVSAGPTP